MARLSLSISNCSLHPLVPGQSSLPLTYNIVRYSSRPCTVLYVFWQWWWWSSSSSSSYTAETSGQISMTITRRVYCVLLYPTRYSTWSALCLDWDSNSVRDNNNGPLKDMSRTHQIVSHAVCALTYVIACTCPRAKEMITHQGKKKKSRTPPPL